MRTLINCLRAPIFAKLNMKVQRRIDKRNFVHCYRDEKSERFSVKVLLKFSVKVFC